MTRSGHPRAVSSEPAVRKVAARLNDRRDELLQSRCSERVVSADFQLVLAWGPALVLKLWRGSSLRAWMVAGPPRHLNGSPGHAIELSGSFPEAGAQMWAMIWRTGCPIACAMDTINQYISKQTFLDMAARI